MLTVKKERIRKRQLKSFYYDKYNAVVDKATAFNVRPVHRPNRFVYLGQFFKRPANKTIKELLIANDVSPWHWIRKENEKKKDLPF